MIRVCVYLCDVTESSARDARTHARTEATLYWTLKSVLSRLSYDSIKWNRGQLRPECLWEIVVIFILDLCHSNYSNIRIFGRQLSVFSQDSPFHVKLNQQIGFCSPV